MEKICTNCKHYSRINNFPYGEIRHQCKRWVKTKRSTNRSLVTGDEYAGYLPPFNCVQERKITYLLPYYFMIRYLSLSINKHDPCCKSGRHFEPK